MSDVAERVKKIVVEHLGVDGDKVKPEASFIELGELVQPSRKVITAFAGQGDFDPAKLTSNHFEMEWPPKSGRKQSFPEVDRAAWFMPAEAREKIQPGQAPFIDRLLQRLQSKRAAAR